MTPFYLCINPQVIMPGEIEACIYSYKKPRFFAVVEKIGHAEPVTAVGYAGANVIFTYGLGDEKPRDYLLAVNDNIDRASYAQLQKKLVKAAEWYIKVRALQTAARQVQLGFLHDYAPSLPGLQLIRYRGTGNCLLSYGPGVKGFASLDEAKTFMRDQLRLPEAIVYGECTVNADEPEEE